MTFQLDTSGRVECAASFQPIGWAIWSDLSPFTQGYIEALFASEAEAAAKAWWLRKSGPFDIPRPGFSDLAPEALARIIADCEVGREIYAGIGPRTQAEKGRQFWEDRQAEMMRRFPPLTVQLGDDGKVRFAEPAQPRSDQEGAGQ